MRIFDDICFIVLLIGIGIGSSPDTLILAIMIYISTRIIINNLKKEKNDKLE